MHSELLWNLAAAGVVARCLHVVAELGAADHVESNAVPVAELADACGAACDPLDRVLRLLTMHGVFEPTPTGYRHTAASALLRTDHPASMRPFARMMGLPLVWNSLAELERSVRTGRSGSEPRGMSSYLRDARVDVDAVLGACDFHRFDTVADVGGGRGHLLQAVLDAAPEAAGLLFELPAVIDALDIEHPRLTAVPGDFFVDALPAADAYLLVDVLDEWPDAECVAILSAIRRAARVGATLLVIEDVPGEDQRAAALDVVRLAVTGGRERSPSDVDGLLRRSGFAVQQVVIAGTMHVVEARAF